MTAVSQRPGLQAILLDIEGTTTPVAFVYDVLFPYARARLHHHLQQRVATTEYASLIDRLHDEYRQDRGAGHPVPAWVEGPPADRLPSVVEYACWLMDRDRKSTPLKELQGRIWEEGYRNGELTGEVFPDVPPAFERWHSLGLTIAIFSSGSERAQQLLFRHSASGDLTRFIRAYFDTTIGSKTEAESYRRIAAALTIRAQSVLFVSDVTRELDAARTAGMDTRLSKRLGNPPSDDDRGHVAVRSFAEILPATHDELHD